MIPLRIRDWEAVDGRFLACLASDSQFRWIGPENGMVHLATAAVINAVWDLYAKADRKPPWKLLTDMPAEELIGAIDFRYLKDALTPGEALAIVRGNEATRERREAELLAGSFPAYTTSA